MLEQNLNNWYVSLHQVILQSQPFDKDMSLLVQEANDTQHNYQGDMAVHTSDFRMPIH